MFGSPEIAAEDEHNVTLAHTFVVMPVVVMVMSALVVVPSPRTSIVEAQPAGVRSASERRRLPGHPRQRGNGFRGTELEERGAAVPVERPNENGSLAARLSKSSGDFVSAQLVPRGGEARPWPVLWSELSNDLDRRGRGTRGRRGRRRRAAANTLDVHGQS